VRPVTCGLDGFRRLDGAASIGVEDRGVVTVDEAGTLASKLGVVEPTEPAVCA
jgi:hypothetical protein